MTRALLLVALSAIALVSGPGTGSAQRVPLPDSIAGDTSATPSLPPDSAFRRPPITAGGAFLRSLLLPGWAQADLGHEARGGFYFLAETFSLLMIARTQQRLDHARRTLPEDDNIISAREQQREDWIALAVFWALFSAADGWVSVQLYGFDDVTGVTPGQTAFLIGWKIPLGP